MIAEKKLDRERSARVAKLEGQATASSSAPKVETSSSKQASDGVPSDQLASDESEAARKKAVEQAERKHRQLEKAVRESVLLTEELTTLKAKLAGLTDEDYAKTDLFKALREQHVDTIKRVNDLEAINLQLQEEAKTLQGERTLFREEADNELRTATIELQSQLAQSEAEIARAKHDRDVERSRLAQREGTVEDHRASMEQLRSLVEAKDTRITALEAEAERLRGRESASASTDTAPADAATLQQKLDQAVRERSSLEKELRSMETAFRKASATANKKINDILNAEQTIQRLSADKTKAEQARFAAQKATEFTRHENKLLRAQEVKSSDIVSQLKEAESSSRALLITLEKQLAEVKDALGSVTSQYRSAQLIVTEQKSTVERLSSQSEELKKMLLVKDSAAQTAEAAQRRAEDDLVEFKAKFERQEKSLAAMKKKAAGNESEELEILRVGYTVKDLGRMLVLIICRVLLSAMSAIVTGKTRSLNLAATSAAKNAWKSKSRCDRESALFAARSLVLAIICM